MATTTHERLDVERVLDAADLEFELGPPDAHVGGKPRWLCWMHQDHRPSVYVYEQGGRQRWRCWPCGKTGDVIDLLDSRDRMDFTEALHYLSGVELPRPPRYRPAPSPAPTPPAPPAPEPSPADDVDSIPPDLEPGLWADPEWQSAVEKLVCEAESFLWSAEGRPFLDWLRRRGLQDLTVSRYRLGAVPVDHYTSPIASLTGEDGRPRGLFVRRGILVPWVRPGGWLSRSEPCPFRWIGANARRLGPDFGDPAEGDKNACLKGSQRGHLYPDEPMSPGRPVVLAEGEWDALIGQQECGHMVDFATVGGAQQRPRPAAARVLRGASRLLLAYDPDPAGDSGVAQWRRRDPARVRKLQLWGGDLSDLHRQGVDLRGWLSSEMERLGLSPSR